MSADQHPEHWSGTLCAMTLFVSVTGNNVNKPPPCAVMPGLAVRVLCVTTLLMSASCVRGGPSGTEPLKMPPPLAEPLGPLATPVLSLRLVFRSVSTPMLATPPPSTVEDPVVVAAVRRLALMRLSLIVIRSNAAVTIAPAAACATPAEDVALTLLPLKRVLLIVESAFISPAPESASVNPVAVVAATLLLLIVLSRMTIGPLACRPPEKALALPLVFVELSEFPVMAVLRAVAEAFSWTWMPPPVALWSTSLGTVNDASALLSLTRLSSIVRLPPTISMPPPLVKRPLGALTAAWLSVTTLCLSASVPKARLRIPPPTALLANPEAASAWLSLTRVWSSVSVPSLEIPPPPESANGQHGSSDSIAVAGAVRLPRMTLLRIVTVAPVDGPAARGM